jgi:hypothetical protein
VKTRTKLASFIFLLGTTLTAFADTVPSTGHLYRRVTTEYGWWAPWSAETREAPELLSVCNEAAWEF